MNFTPQNLKRLKCDLAKHLGRLPKNSELLTLYRKYVRQGKLKSNHQFEKLLRFRTIRTASGVAPVAIFTKPWPCNQKCLYCPISATMPESYLPDEPAMQRAISNKYDPIKQIQQRLRQYKLNGHSTDKIELIIMGGTFSYLPKNYRLNFIKKCYQALNNDFSSSKIIDLQAQNATASHRLVGLSVETRPDCITTNELKFFRRLGVTRVEIGVQSIRNSILKTINRGHNVQSTIKATQLLKNFGFKVIYHFMPNLPDATPNTDLTDYKKLWSDPRFRPDQIKIYPTLLIKPSGLYKLWKNKQWKPYDQKTLIKLLLKIKLATPHYTRINRLYRDIPAHHVVAGSKLSSMRQHLQQLIKKHSLQECQCIRCRELKNNSPVLPFCFITTRLKSTPTHEYFLQALDANNKLLAILRLRIASPNKKQFAIIRELHVYGQSLPIIKTKTRLSNSAQHRQLGQQLITKSANIAKKNSCNRLYVIISPGTRKYWEKLNFSLTKFDYMFKKLL